LRSRGFSRRRRLIPDRLIILHWNRTSAVPPWSVHCRVKNVRLKPRLRLLPGLISRVVSLVVGASAVFGYGLAFVRPKPRLRLLFNPGFPSRVGQLTRWEAGSRASAHNLIAAWLFRSCAASRHSTARSKPLCGVEASAGDFLPIDPNLIAPHRRAKESSGLCPRCQP
jgi:hypothetical protein